MSGHREVEFDFLPTGTLSRTDSACRGGRDMPLLEQQYYFNDARIEDGLGCALSPALADWLDVANAVYQADRLLLRECSHSRSACAGWARSIRVHVDVRDVRFWKDSGAAAIMKEALLFLTDDVWEFDFRKRSFDQDSHRQQYLFRSVPPTAKVAPLTGGPDSFAGALTRRAASPHQHFVSVSGATNCHQQGRQNAQFQCFRKATRHNVTHIVVRHGLLNVSRPRDLETTQRSRGFLHLSLGCVTALACGVRSLHVYENGIGAINLPFDGSQIGTQNSRPVNPVTLAQIARLASLVGNVPFKIFNPCFYVTKGEALAATALLGARDLLKNTISCDHPTRQRKSRPQCGRCTSCLLRRLSFESAGLAEFDPGEFYETYFRCPSSVEPQRYQMFEKMDWQAKILRLLLAEPHPWAALSAEYPMLARVASQLTLAENDPAVAGKLVRLYSTYTKEWEAFATNRRPVPVLRAA